MLDAAYAMLVDDFRKPGTPESEAVRLVEELLLPERERVAKQNARGMQSLMKIGASR